MGSTRRPCAHTKVSLFLLWLLVAVAVADIATAIFVGSGVAAATKGSSSDTGGHTSSQSPNPSTGPKPGADNNGQHAASSVVGGSPGSGKAVAVPTPTRADHLAGSISALPVRIPTRAPIAPADPMAKHVTARSHTENTANNQISDMADNGSINNLAGVVLLDGVAPDPTEVSTTVAKVPHNLPILMIASPPYWLNDFGQTPVDLVNARPGQFDGVELVGGRHIDAMQGGNPLIQLSAYLVGGFSRPQNIDAVKILASGWINDMLAGTDKGIYGMPGQTIQIPTNAGTATAIALGARTKPRAAPMTAQQSLVKRGSQR